MVGVIVEEEGEPLARPRLLSPPLLSANAAITPPPAPLAAVMSGEIPSMTKCAVAGISFLAAFKVK